MSKREKKLKDKTLNLQYKIIILIIFIISALASGRFKDLQEVFFDTFDIRAQRMLGNEEKIFSYSDVLELGLRYEGEPYKEVNGNLPFFTNEDYEIYSRASFEKYSSLDSLGRCGSAFANIGTDLMPTGERGDISGVRPSGWRNKKYSGLVEGNYLYNRCHLIAHTLAGENDNPLNLITGTRYFNAQGMLPFEIEVADYVRQTKKHVLYRVTPVFKDKDLIANGVLMEAYSVEDKGERICFCVYVFNVQPGIEIDYLTGESRKNNKRGDR